MLRLPAAAAAAAACLLLLGGARPAAAAPAEDILTLAAAGPVPLDALLRAIHQSPRLEETPAGGPGSEGLVGKAPPDAEPPRLTEPLTPRDFAMAEVARIEEPPIGPNGTDPIELASAFEGDIVIPPGDFSALNEDNAIIKPHKVWTGGVINYALSPAFTSSERAVIASAVKEFERQTCMQMRPIRPGAGGDYVYVVKKTGCFSSVGRSGGMQELSLGDGCVYKGIAMHEFMHAAGFWHEQSRPDRDDYVNVHYDNIQPMMEFNFQKYTWGDVQDLGEPYDIGSIMHYGRYAFARDRSRPTLTDRRNTGITMGQRRDFSAIDARKLNKLYKCGGGGTVTPPPKPTPKPPPPKPTGSCKNKNTYCDWWASRGECSKNSAYMHRDCAKACRVCTTGKDCVDLNNHCAYWAREGECTKNPSYMLSYCEKSCDKCSVTITCKDKDSNCSYWAKNSECTRNPQFMKLYCKRSCGLC